jgi:hypothetical protein
MDDPGNDGEGRASPRPVPVSGVRVGEDDPEVPDRAALSVLRRLDRRPP